MFEIFGKRFFEAVHAQAELQLGRGHPCVAAAARAAGTCEQTDVEAAQFELAQLPAETSALLMEQVHKTLREDPEALLEQWSGPAPPGRQN